MVRQFRINKVYHKERPISNRYNVYCPSRGSQGLSGVMSTSFPFIERVTGCCGVERQERVVARAF